MFYDQSRSRGHTFHQHTNTMHSTMHEHHTNLVNTHQHISVHNTTHHQTWVHIMTHQCNSVHLGTNKWSWMHTPMYISIHKPMDNQMHIPIHITHITTHHTTHQARASIYCDGRRFNILWRARQYIGASRHDIWARHEIYIAMLCVAC